VAKYTETDLQSTVAKNIAALREEAGWTQAQLAEAVTELGFDWKRVTVAEVEGADRRVSLEELLGLSALYAVPMFSMLVPSPTHSVDIVFQSAHPDDVRELMLGPGGRLGTGGPNWRVAARAAGRVESRPARPLWRSRRTVDK
jgi:transcriptional regulator with XRE-family HTH domain